MKKIGCTILSSLGLMAIGILVVMSLIFGDFNKLTNNEALELIEDPGYIKLEKYLFHNNSINNVRYQGDPVIGHQNVWRINEFIVDYDTSMVVTNPGNDFDFPKRKHSTSLRYISFDNKVAIDSLFGENFSFDSLRLLLHTAQELKVISISKYDSGDFIEVRLQNSSPISSGFGILAARKAFDVKNRQNIYDELIGIDSTHYRFVEYVQ